MIRLATSLDAEEIAEIHAIYMQPESWGLGHGRQLMETAETELQRSNVGAIMLWVLERNLAAIGFYAQVGCGADGARKRLSIGGRDLWEVRPEKKFGSSA